MQETADARILKEKDQLKKGSDSKCHFVHFLPDPLTHSPTVFFSIANSDGLLSN